jgi:hypothetical protein
MTKRSVFHKAIAPASLVFMLLVNTAPADAWWPRRHAQCYPEIKHRRFLPRTHRTIFIDGVDYYYDNGIFYRRGRSGYVFITAPTGAVVPELPRAYHVLVINGRTYYSFDNVYYVESSQGYQVVQRPTVYEVPAQTVVMPEESFVVHVPNANGSYTPVVITRSGDEYVGPHGEYYHEQPTVDQLRAMYAK